MITVSQPFEQGRVPRWLGKTKHAGHLASERRNATRFP